MINNFYIISEYKYINGKNNNVVKPHKITDRIFSFCVAVYVESGSFFVEINGKVYNIKRGETVIIPSFTPHAVGTEEESVVTFSHFYCSYLNFDIFRFEKKDCIISCNKNLRNILMEMNNSTLKDGFLFKIRTDKAICDIILALQSENNLKINIDDADVYLYKILIYIKQNINRGIDVSEVIAECGYKKTTLYKVFADKMKMSPHDYIEQERMKLAMQMLAEGIKAKEIAFAIGYSDEFYFIKKFKKVVGKTTTQYKKSMEEIFYDNEKGE